MCGVCDQVYDDASDQVPLRVVLTLLKLRRHFGACTKFWRGADAKGFGGANHEAISVARGTWV